MKKFLPAVLVALIFCGFSIAKVNAQCANDNVLTAGNLTPPGVALSTTQNFQCGQYVVAQVVSGANYTVATCSNSSFDSQITVYDDVTGAFIAYNDDGCGVLSTVSFTATNCNTVRILLDQYFCTTSTSSLDVTMTMNTAGSGAPTLTPASDSAECFGGTTTIGVVSNGSGGVPPYNYSWLPITNLSSPTASQTAVTSVTSNATYTLTITDANGCTATDEVQVSVLPAPTVNLGADTTVCGTQFVIDAGNPGSAYLWNTAQGTQTIAVTQSGNYAVTVQDPSGCQAGDNIIVTLNTPPSYTLGNDTSSCSSNVVLDAGSGYVSYTWSTGGTSQNETISSNDTVAVTVVDANGCVLTDTIEVTLSPAPSVNLGPDTTQCGGSVTLDAGNAGSLYFWSNSTSSQTTTVSASGIYAVNVLTQAGCSGMDTVVVTINNQPVVNLGPDTSICLATVILDAGNPGSTYAWSTSATSQSVTVGSGTYSVTATDPSGCADSDTITVTTNVPPVITATPQTTSVCAGSPTTLSATGGLTYLWSNNQTGSSTIVSPTTTTSYYVTGTDINGCQASDVVIVNVLPGTTALFTYTLNGVTAQFTNQSSGAVTYSWNFGDSSPTSSLQNPSHVYTQNGVYTVTLTVTGPCGTSTYTQTITITQVGIVDADLANTLSIYPNPNDGVFTVSFEFTNAKDVRVDLTDVTGRIISSEERYGVTSYRNEVGSTDLSNGVYFVRITTVDGSAVQKIVVQR
ncbi:MAG: hypothetical protein RL007_49 [Bacteroidota bacterium]|jgi:PKD repeat protein